MISIPNCICLFIELLFSALFIYFVVRYKGYFMFIFKIILLDCFIHERDEKANGEDFTVRNLKFCTIHLTYLGAKIYKIEMDRARSQNGKSWECLRTLTGKLRRKRPLRRTILE